MTKPIYCPNCGKVFVGDNSVVCSIAFFDEYICICIFCYWSGYIRPDDENSLEV